MGLGLGEVVPYFCALVNFSWTLNPRSDKCITMQNVSQCTINAASFGVLSCILPSMFIYIMYSCSCLYSHNVHVYKWKSTSIIQHHIMIMSHLGLHHIVTYETNKEQTHWVISLYGIMICHSLTNNVRIFQENQIIHCKNTRLEINDDKCWWRGRQRWQRQRGRW